MSYTLYSSAVSVKVRPGGERINIRGLELQKSGGVGSNRKNGSCERKLPRVFLCWRCQVIFFEFDEKDVAIQTRLACVQRQEVQIWRTRKGIYRKKVLPDVRDVEMDASK